MLPTLRALLGVVAISFAAPIQAESDDSFMSGADISALQTLEDDGAIYRWQDGTPGDAIEIMRDRGIDWYRLRLFLEPDGIGVVNNDLAYTTALAKRIKARGGQLLLDFHYSDTWADPGKQFKPKAWEGLSFEELVDQVESYTHDVIVHMSEAGVRPAIVQIGNEITGGMIWPDGKLWGDGIDSEQAFDRLSEFLRAGVRGIQSATTEGPTPEIMIHIARGDRWGESEYFFNQLQDREVEFDLIGYSYYPRYHGSIAEVRENLTRTAETYGKPIVLVEFGFAYTGGEWEPQQDKFEHEVTPQGQAAITREVVELVAGLPDGLGRGVYWWHAAATRSPSNLAWSDGRLGLFDQDGRVLPAAAELGRRTAE